MYPVLKNSINETKVAELAQMCEKEKKQNKIKEKTRKVNVNFTIDKHLYEQFKRVAQKDMRKYSNIVEGSIRRYVQSRL